MLSGGHAVVFGWPAIVTAVNQRIFVTVKENGTDVFHLDAPDLGLIAYAKTIDTLGKKELPKSVRFIEILYKNFLLKYPQKKGIVVTTRSDFSSTFGFGSSSAATVAFAKALTELYGLQLTNTQLFEMCYETVLEVQGVGSGFDIASAIWGGALYYKKNPTVVKPIDTNNLPILVCYTGIKADTPTLVRMVESQYDADREKITRIFNQVGDVSEDLLQILSHHDTTRLGELFTTHQEQMEVLGVSSTKIEALIAAAIEAGSLGATLSGAGGGDCILVVTPEGQREKIVKALEAAGGEIMRVEIGATGVVLE